MPSSEWDDWFGNIARSSTRDAFVNEHLGLPSGFPTNNLLPYSAAEELVAQLRLDPNDTLLDLACGRGAWGVEIAARAAARLIGVDGSRIALDLARERARTVGIAASFHQAAMTAIALRTASVDAVLCLDSLQFARPPAAVIAEGRRVLRPRGRIVITWWEPADRTDSTLSPRIRDRDAARDLYAAGFGDVNACDRPDWYEAERALWESLANAPQSSDSALSSLQGEAQLVLATFNQMHRVLAIATAPREC